MFETLGFEYKKYGTDFAYEYEVERGIKFVHFDLIAQEYCTNIYHVNKRLHNAVTMQMKELGWLDSELYEFNNPKPYTFEELHEGMWVWDKFNKDYTKITGFIEMDNSSIVELTKSYYCSRVFEENRFYPPNKANEGK